MSPRFPLTLAALLALIALFAVAPASAMATEEVAAAPEVAQATAPLPAGEVESDNSAPFLDEPPEDFRPRGPFVSVGYGLHRYAMNSLSMEQDSNDRRLFDGAALSIQAGYLSSWGGLVGVDWAHHSGKTTLNTLAASMSLRLRTDFLSLLAGMQFGGRIRFHLALLAGVALAQFDRGIRVDEEVDGERVSRRDARESSAQGFTLGVEMGLVVMPMSWLAIGLRARAASPLFSDALEDTGGITLGLSAAFVFPL